MKVTALLGSLREGSYNRMLLNTAIELAPQGMDIQVPSLRDIPPYDYDREQRDPPLCVRELKQAIGAL